MVDKKQLSLKIPPQIYDQLDNYVMRIPPLSPHWGDVGGKVVANALAQYLGCADDVPLLQRMAHLEVRLAALEALQQ